LIADPRRVGGRVPPQPDHHGGGAIDAQPARSADGRVQGATGRRKGAKYRYDRPHTAQRGSAAR
jgi:hypothetical protein